MRKMLFISISIFLLCTLSFAESSDEPSILFAEVKNPGGEDKKDEHKADAPKGFRKIEIGMEIKSVKEILKDDPLFDYKGDPDVSFLPLSEQTLIECAGNLYIDRAYFQFKDDKLFIITIELNRAKLDYFSFFSRLSEKYGKPTSLSPSESVWMFANIRLSLEKPLSVKYIDRAVFDKLKEQGRTTEHLEDISREQFLEQF